MSTLHEEFNKLMEEQAELRAKFQVKAQELFKSVTKEFFEKNPGVQAIMWTQYTPYFNDGDTCEFGVNDPHFTNANAEQREEFTAWGEYEGEDEEVWSNELWGFKYDMERNPHKNFDGINLDDAKAFAEMICSGDMEEVMEAMFGDHVRVTATREGFDVDEHDHD